MDTDEPIANSLIQTVFGKFLAASKERLDLTYDYERSTINSFYEISKYLRAETLIDVGANIGVYSIFLSSMKHMERVYAFEPAPASFELMKNNFGIQVNPETFVAHNAAVSSSSGKRKLHVVSPLSGANSIAQDEGADGEFVDVDSVTIDEVVQSQGARMSVKIDVEGHELEVLKGMQRTLRENVCFIQVECLDDRSSTEVKTYLSSLGYNKIFSFRNDHLFLESSMDRHRSRLIDIICGHLALDLADLLQLRRQKRRAAREARRLWKNLAYTHDPILE